MRALLAILILTVNSAALAAESFYGEIHGGFAGIKHSDLTFRPIEAHVSVGGYFWETIGIDLNLGGPLKVGKDDDFTLQLESLTTVSLRFDSPPTDNISASILLGISQFSISQRNENELGARTVRETFQGGTLTVGLRRQLENTPLSVLLAYRLHYVDQPIDIDSWTLGVRAAW